MSEIFEPNEIMKYLKNKHFKIFTFKPFIKNSLERIFYKDEVHESICYIITHIK